MPASLCVSSYGRPPEDIKAVVYDFCESRAAANAKANQIRPAAIGRNNCMLAGSLRARQRAAAVMSLIQLAKLNGHDPHAHLKDVLTSSPTHMNSRIDELLPHRWSPAPQADALPHRHRAERSDA